MENYKSFRAYYITIYLVVNLVLVVSCNEGKDEKVKTWYEKNFPLVKPPLSNPDKSETRNSLYFVVYSMH